MTYLEMKNQFEESIRPVFDMLLSEGGVIDQHKEAHGTKDTYELVHETHRIYKEIANVLYNSDRDEFKALYLAMAYCDRFSGVEAELNRELRKEEFMEELKKSPTISMGELEKTA